MITTTEELIELMKRAHKTNAVALDTEFIWERTFYPNLGLIQLALSDEDCFIIDPLAVKDLSPLGKLLADPSVVKIFHDAPQDLVILRTATGHDPKNIFDTRLAAGFCGYDSTLSLATLVERLLGIKLNKGATRTDWLKRPLDPKQTKYALDDVRYLRAIRILLLARSLSKTNHWLLEELRLFDDLNTYTGLSDTLRYTKIKGIGNLDSHSLAILQELAQWREEEAKRKNRPRGHIVKDNVLLAIARNRLQDREAIQTAGEISHKSVSSYGDDLIQCVKRGESQSTEECPPLLKTAKLTAREESTFTALCDFITLKSDVNGIDPALVGNKKELQAFLTTPNPNARQEKGWRKKFLHEMKNG